MRRHGSPKSLEAVRLQAFDLSEQGISSGDIAMALDRSVRTVQKWVKTAREIGRDALKAKPHPGANPKLTLAQQGDLRQRLIAGPQAAGFSTNLWTCPRIRQLIQEVYGVTYHVDYLSQLLKSLGFSCQKPQRRAAEKDEEAIAHWVARDWPRIKKKRVVSTPPSRLSTKVACF